VHDYRKLSAWQRAHALVLTIYGETAAFPRTELFGLTSQLRRSAVSIPTNVAEGAGSATSRDFRRFVGYSIASSVELEYHLTLSADLGYLSEARRAGLQAELGQVRGMLIRLRETLA